MSDSLQDISNFVLDEPLKAAEELQRLRSLKARLIRTLEPAQAQLQKPVPAGLDMAATMHAYSERSGLGFGTINTALNMLRN